MNPNAGEWKPSAAAAAWTPGSGGAAATAASGTPPPITQVAQPPAPAPAAAAPAAQEQPPPPQQPPRTDSSVSGTSSDIDENDPLWQCVLNKVANGDRERALKLINDPDQLALYPEVMAVLEATGGNSAAASSDDIDDDVAAAQLAEEVQQMNVDENQAERMETEAEQEEDDGKEKAAVVVKEGDPREHLNLVFIGHVDAGKSTLSGNILYLTDNVDKRTIERYEREAKERNRESWFLAFIMDTNEEERAKGKTVEVGKARFETQAKRYTILDAPGHKNYVPNMIQGASQADVGLLVISARKGEFEAGFDRGGQSREHAMLAKTLGVSYLIVVVNKMDEPTVQWKKERFDECVTRIRPFLKSCGFVIKQEVKFIPMSGLGGANVLKEVEESECPWWKQCYTSGENNTSSPTLLQLLDSLEIKGRDEKAPLRIPVLDRYTDRGTIAMGKVECGIVRPGQRVIVMPTRNTYKVDEVWANDADPVSGARPGENVLVKLNGAKVEDIRKGYVICSNPPCRAVDKIICHIAINDMPENTPIMTAGFQCMFHAHTCEEECTVIKIFETTNKKGIVVKGARFANVGMRATVMLELSQSTALETYDDMHFLGRFTLRTEGRTVAIGKVTKLPPKRED